jgi:D-mannonate dehydratase
MNFKNVIGVHNGTLHSLKKEGNPAICYNWMELKDIVLSELIQAGKDKYFIISLIWRI